MVLRVQESGLDHQINQVSLTDLKAQVVVSELDTPSSKPPVDDNYMYDFKYNHPLPTSDVLGIEIPSDCDAQKEAETIVARLSESMGAGDAQAFTDLFLPYGRSYSVLPYGMHMQPTDMTIPQYRCLARQAVLHLGLPHIQLPPRHLEGCPGPFPHYESHQLQVLQSRSRGFPPIPRFCPATICGVI